MPPQASNTEASNLHHEWPLPSSVTLGSTVRAKGIERELRRKLAWGHRTFLSVETGRAVLLMPASEAPMFGDIRERLDGEIADLQQLPILPSELEDILSISSRERHKWLSAGRLQSAGTRTVKLRGRAKKVTFHVFDARHVEDILNADLPEIWREDDALTVAENRKRAAAKAAMKRTNKTLLKTSEDAKVPLAGWDDFEAEGFLR